jgi:HEAT repeat protein
VLDAAGRLVKEDRHRIAESEELKVLHFFCLFGAPVEKAPAEWTVEKSEDAGREYRLRLENCPVQGRLRAAVRANGALEVTEDGRLKGEGESKPGRFEARFVLDSALDALPPGLKFSAAAESPVHVAQAPSPARGDAQPGAAVPHPAGLAPAAPATEPPTATEPPRAESDAPEQDPDVLRKIRKLIRNTLSQDVEDREKAWKELRDMGNLAVPGLLELYRRKETTPEMVRSILIALGDTKDPRAGPALVEVLGSPDPLVRRDAARAIGDSNYKAGLPALKKRFADAQEPEEVRLFAATAAAKLGSPEALETLRELAAAQAPATRTRAVFALGKYGGAAQLKLVAAALGDPEATVRADAVEALRLIGGPEAAAAVLRALTDADHQIRGRALDALKSLTNRKPGPVLVEALAGPDRSVRLAAARALSELGDKDALPALRKSFAHAEEDEEVRLHAALAAARLDSPEAVDALKVLARSTQPLLRARALVGLGRYCPAQLKLVALGLSDTDVSVRAAAVEGLALIGKTACGTLVAATKDADADVREAAMDALAALTGQELGKDPQAWRDWWAQEEKKEP